MAGRRKTPEQPCSSGAPLNALWPPTFCAKTRRLCCFRNGSSVTIRSSSTRMGIPGTACSSKAFQLLNRFWQDDRVRIRQPRRNLQLKFVRPLSGQNEFVAYIDAIGQLDDRGCLLEWKTTSSRYPEKPDGLLALDPQLICYSWITGVSEVAQVVFVRKRLVEIQYLHTTITDEQRLEFGQLVEATIRQIESAQFLPHSGIRFPQNPCSSCSYIGLCLGRQELVEAALIRRPGAEQRDWLDKLYY